MAPDANRCRLWDRRFNVKRKRLLDGPCGAGEQGLAELEERVPGRVVKKATAYLPLVALFAKPGEPERRQAKPRNQWPCCAEDRVFRNGMGSTQAQAG